MPLTTVQRMKLGDALVSLRPDWDAERWHRMSVDKALLELAENPAHPAVLMVQAITAAGNAANLTPECVNRPPAVGMPAVTPRPTPRATDPECGVCGSQIVRADGTCHGCWQNAAVDGTAVVRPLASKPYRTAVPQPADFWAQVQSHKPARTATNGDPS